MNCVLLPAVQTNLRLLCNWSHQYESDVIPLGNNVNFVSSVFLCDQQSGKKSLLAYFCIFSDTYLLTNHMQFDANT